VKLAGHTLGTPDHTIDEALTLFSELELDGAEIIWQDDYPAAIPESNDEEARRVGDVAGSLGLEIACLTPYVFGLNSLDDVERGKDVDRYRHCVEVAAELGAPAVRVYGGTYHPDEHLDHHGELWKRLVDSLRTLGEHSKDLGVTLCVENHFSTMTMSARETADLMRDVDSGGVGILYDQANLSFTHCEPYDEAIVVQAPWIRHVQVKDFEFIDATRPFTASHVDKIDAEDRAVRSRPVGKGVLDWPAIVAALDAIGYEGFLSLEYEYRWHRADLPEPRVGFKRGADVLRSILNGR
jgi:sugar phosphate isomerase/epimerase